MEWRERYADKLTTAAEAAKEIQSGQSLWVGMFNGVPITFGKALLARAPELQGVNIYHYISPFPWVTPQTGDAFHLTTAFTTPVDRGLVNDGVADYLPLGNFSEEHLVAHHPRMDTAALLLSPPDENGFMSFGAALWANKTLLQLSDRVIAEIDERLIRTHGENFIHISEVERIWEHDEGDDMAPPIPPRNEEVEAAANVICALVANELIEDGDCLQMGLGDVSAALAIFLDNRHDIGVQSELIPGGVMEMVERGVINGAKKQVAPGKVIGSAFAQTPPEELAKAHMNPLVELWDFCHTDDLRMLVQNHNFKAINNALQIDVTGQVTAETFGPRVFSGPGGQTVFAVAASYSPGGASIIVLPSSSLVDGERRTRIVPTLPQGAMVTVPRTFVDYVVTEHGIAKLAGRTLRERIDELTGIARPDFRAELRKEAKAAFGF